jgi:hypothetical protein
VLLTVIFVLLIANSLFGVKVANANGIFQTIYLPIPEGTEPIQVAISSPENNSAFTSDSVTILFDASAPESVFP